MPGVARRGTSDLAIGELKFSGNSVRCKRDTLLYHGTMLYDFDLSLIDELSADAAAPARLSARSAARGVRRPILPASRDAIREALIGGWQCREPPTIRLAARSRCSELVASARYGQRRSGTSR